MRLGTRRSALALAQARAVADALPGEIEIVEVRTGGDAGAAVGDKSRWVDGLERTLLDGSIDLAVHSAKDVPAELADGLELLGVPAREDPRDALVGAPSIKSLAAGARIGTTSLRRRAALLAGRDARASLGMARSTPWCSRWPACVASAARTPPTPSWTPT